MIGAVPTAMLGLLFDVVYLSYVLLGFTFWQLLFAIYSNLYTLY